MISSAYDFYSISSETINGSVQSLFNRKQWNRKQLAWRIGITFIVGMQQYVRMCASVSVLLCNCVYMCYYATMLIRNNICVYVSALVRNTLWLQRIRINYYIPLEYEESNKNGIRFSKSFKHVLTCAKTWDFTHPRWWKRKGMSN